MNINIIAVGKIKENFIKSGIEEFIKRTQPYSSIKIIEIEASKYNCQNCLINKNLEIEAKKILNQIPDFAYVIILDIYKKQLDSEEFALQIKEINLKGINHLIYVIGGAFGLSEKVKQRADFSLSLSKMTFPHQLVRLFLVEQIYRAFRIINNEPYHK
ncbi:MAG: 23S rRNA (pseudouridine(1915)-N(3))-methyltransferase RlmH [bacterium]